MSKLTMILNDTETNSDKLISLKELYDALELNKSQWARWVKRNIINNKSFKENKDYIVLEQSTTALGGRPTKKSHDYRNYFIKIKQKVQEVLSGDDRLFIELGRSV